MFVHSLEGVVPSISHLGNSEMTAVFFGSAVAGLGGLLKGGFGFVMIGQKDSKFSESNEYSLHISITFDRLFELDERVIRRMYFQR